MKSLPIIIRSASLGVIIVLLSSCGGHLSCKNSVGGVTCESLTTAYEHRYDTPGRTEGTDESKEKKAHHEEERSSTEIVKRLALDKSLPVRIPPKIIRIWIAPWEDADGDLHQPGYIFSEINDRRGRWIFGEKETSSSQPMLYPLNEPSTETDDKGLEPRRSGKLDLSGPK
jgi:conjugal transfer pilus assembly protein TraV